MEDGIWTGLGEVWVKDFTCSIEEEKETKSERASSLINLLLFGFWSLNFFPLGGLQKIVDLCMFSPS